MIARYQNKEINPIDSKNNGFRRSSVVITGLYPCDSLICKQMSYILDVRNILTISEVVMARTMTVDLGNELRNYVESLVTAGDYRSNSEVLRESLRLLREKQAESKLDQLRHLIDEGEASGDPLAWDVQDFLEHMKKKIHAK